MVSHVDVARCAWCGGPLPAPIETLTVVYGPASEAIATCSTACLAGLVADLAGRAEGSRYVVAGRRN
jgi:hypothetical protein